MLICILSYLEISFTICRFSWSRNVAISVYQYIWSNKLLKNLHDTNGYCVYLKCHWPFGVLKYIIEYGSVWSLLEIKYCNTAANSHKTYHDDVIKWKHFPRFWPFVRSPANSPHKGRWRGALMFSSISAWINGWVNNREAGDLRRHHAHYDVIVMPWNMHTDVLRVHLTGYFFHRISSLSSTSFCSDPRHQKLMATKFRIWYDSCAVVVFAKL